MAPDVSGRAPKDCPLPCPALAPSAHLQNPGGDASVGGVGRGREAQCGHRGGSPLPGCPVASFGGAGTSPSATQLAARPARLSPRPPLPVVAPGCPPCVARSLPCASSASGSSWARPSKRKPAHSGEGSLGLYGKGRQEKREEDGPAVDAASTPSPTDGVRSPKVAQPVRGRPGVPIAAPRRSRAHFCHLLAPPAPCSAADSASWLCTCRTASEREIGRAHV